MLIFKIFSTALKFLRYAFQNGLVKDVVLHKYFDLRYKNGIKLVYFCISSVK